MDQKKIKIIREKLKEWHVSVSQVQRYKVFLFMFSFTALDFTS